MFAEDMALCWQMRAHGHDVAATPDALVTHIEGVSRARASRAMLIAHHAAPCASNGRPRADGDVSWRRLRRWCSGFDSVWYW